MRALNWLKRLYRSDRGNVLVLGAVTMPLLMGSAGLAVDTVQLTLWNRQLQRAADSASIAGARAIAQGASTNPAVANDFDEHVQYDLEENETPLITEQHVVSSSYAEGTIANSSCATRAVTPCYPAVQVTIQTERRLPFMGMFTASPTIVRAKATAAVFDHGEFCLVSLYDGTDAGIVALGNPTLDLQCGMSTNSRATNAMNVGGSASITASPVAAVGGIAGGRHYTSGTTLQPFSAPVADPFAAVPNPVLPSGCTTTSLLSFSNQQGTLTNPIELDPAVSGNCFGNWDISGYVHLKPGTYFVNNGTLDIKGKLSGEGVTLILMGNDSTWTQNGGGKLALTAPATGPYKGIVVFRDRSATNKSNKEIKLNGGADLSLVGAIYGSSTDFWVGGNAALNAECIQVVGRKLEFKGGGTIKNKCSGTGSGPFKAPTVKLVG